MADVERAAARAFAPVHHYPLPRIAAEVEWLCMADDDPWRQVTVAEARRAIGAHLLPAGGTITYEPGGQIELSSAPFLHPADLGAALRRDTDEVVARCTRAGLRLVAIGLDPVRPPTRSLVAPRYDAMEQAFDRRGPEGRSMMCATASLQVNVDFGPDPVRSWRTANRWAPVLAAMFANAPISGGVPSGLPDLRQRIWGAIDPTRTRPVLGDGSEGWAEYVIDAEALAIDASAPGTTFGAWMADGVAGRHPTIDELSEHITTLFPPVRPRGWLEFRMVDAVGIEARQVAVATMWALVTHPEANQVAETLPEWEPDWQVDPPRIEQDAVRAAALTLLEMTKEMLVAEGGATSRSGEEPDAPLRNVAWWQSEMTGRGQVPADLTRSQFDPKRPDLGLVSEGTS